MFGIGLDDAYIIFGEFKRTDDAKDPVERIHDTFEEIGLSICLTKLTTAICFALGMVSNIPTLYWLSLYAFPTIVADFIYQITFFVALVVLDTNRINAQRRDCCFWSFNCPKSNIDLSDISSDEESCSSDSNLQQRRKPDGADVTEETFTGIATTTQVQQKSKIDRFMGWYAQKLLKPYTKAFVILSFIGLAAWFSYSTTLFTQEFALTKMLPNDSFIKDFLKAVENHGDGGGIMPAAYFRDVDHSDPFVQQVRTKKYRLNKLC